MRLIDADALAQDLEYDVEQCARALDVMDFVGNEREHMQFEKDCKQNCMWYISEAPTIDAVPVRHGRWIRMEQLYPELLGYSSYIFECSECGYSDEHSENLDVPWCWHCGAKMDLGDGE